jgi:hypothetical protein
MRDSGIGRARKVAASNEFSDALLKVSTAIAAIGTILVGCYQYRQNVQGEFHKKIWDEQYALYKEACGAASALACAHSLSEVQTEHVAFWRLFWGRLSILEDNGVKQAMQDFGTQLRKVESDDVRRPALSSLEQYSYRLAVACRNSLKTTWEPSPVDTFDENKPPKSKCTQ